MNTIDDTEILHKIIELQSCIIHGRNIKPLLHQNIDFYLEKSAADIITLYMHHDETVQIDYILEKHRHFAHLLKKYVDDKKHSKWEEFAEHCKKHFASRVQYRRVTDLSQLFHGLLTKKEAASFEAELKMQQTIMMPMYAFDNKEIIGYICFLFQSEAEADIKKLEAVRTSFQILLQPLYDSEHRTFFTRCMRIDEKLELLTPKEKKIVHYVLDGACYQEVADALHISTNTLKTHMRNIFNKYNVNSKIELYNKLNGHL
ncbi:MAG TPA: helix-turn-helix transcriptional regulator [Sulfurovum sp.]|uniref:response regulator transcription factor n=1 Tax=Sulfurovum sp. TaxID=1969726 RepID=UPI002F93EC4C